MNIICPKTNRICESTGCTKENNCLTQPPSNSGDKNLTAMGELISECIKARDYLKGIDDDYHEGQFDLYETIIEAATSLLAKEKQQIIDANFNGQLQGMKEDQTSAKYSEEYYTQTFN